jgi:hypothetical protein
VGVFHRKKKWQKVAAKVTSTAYKNPAVTAGVKTGVAALTFAYRSRAVKAGMKAGAVAVTGLGTLAAASAAVSSHRRKTES